jgi:bifunctional non-homologous end joining protein LigD
VPPSGPLWLHEIKHDGFRVIARKDGHRVRLYSRSGNDLTPRFPLIVGALSRLRAGSTILDGEAVACDDNGIPNFDRLRYCHHDDSVLLCAFDLVELDGDDLRREPLVTRKATLASLLSRASPGILINEHFEHDGPTVFAHAAGSALKASSPSAKARPIAQAVRPIGSSARIRQAPRCGGKPKKIGADRTGARPKGQGTDEGAADFASDHPDPHPTS